jgi:hypothetical protein
MSIILAFKRAEDDKLMKFQRAAEFMRVPPDLTILLLLIQIHGSPSIVSIAFMALLRSNRKYARGIAYMVGNRREATL